LLLVLSNRAKHVFEGALLDSACELKIHYFCLVLEFWRGPVFDVVLILLRLLGRFMGTFGLRILNLLFKFLF
jgi:hypothetical protein